MIRVAIGFKYTEEWDSGQRWRSKEVVLVGDGDRRHTDRVLARCPERHRAALAAYLAPLLEGDEPPDGKYTNEFIMWWKRVEVL